MNNNIQTIRKNLGISRRQLANALGVTIQAISNYEYGNRNPSMKHCYRLISLAKDLGVELRVEDIFMQNTT